MDRLIGDFSLITDDATANFISPHIVDFFESNPITHDVRRESWNEYDTICGLYSGFVRSFDAVVSRPEGVSEKELKFLKSPDYHIQQVLSNTLAVRQAQFGPFDAISTLFSTPVFKDFRQDEIQDLERNRGGMKQVKGLVKCKACGSDNVTTISKQLRSADEGMSSIHTCHSCNKGWREN